MNNSNNGKRTVLLRAPIVDEIGISPNSQELGEYVIQKYGIEESMGPSPRLRKSLRYVSADDTYETLVSKLVKNGVRWLDVGCGRDLFPSNRSGAAELANRAEMLVGVDPDDNVHENKLLTEGFQGTIEDYSTNKRFDLVTMRMVAEHVELAERCVQKLAELTAPDGMVVIYTPWKYSPLSMIASIVPFSMHNRLKRLIWNTDEKDTFPTTYRMNTRRDLLRLFSNADFDEVYFCNVDDCSVLTKYLTLNSLEIRSRNFLLNCGVTYPEYCLLAVFKKSKGRN